MISDIYNNEIWKIFSSYSNTTESLSFFIPEYTDSYLEIIINLDWFQPFESFTYNTNVIYRVIYNLSHKIKFKYENILYLDLLSNLNEIKLHKINHYLFLIIDELLEF